MTERRRMGKLMSVAGSAGSGGIEIYQATVTNGPHS